MEVARHWRIRQARYALMGRVCERCGTKMFPPRGLCPECRTPTTTPFAFSGRGELYSYSTVYHAPEGFEEQVPYPVALIRLDEGPMVAAQLTDVDESEMEIGMRVEMVTRRLREDGNQGVLVYGYKFRPAMFAGERGDKIHPQRSPESSGLTGGYGSLADGGAVTVRPGARPARDAEEEPTPRVAIRPCAPVEEGADSALVDIGGVQRLPRISQPATPSSLGPSVMAAPRFSETLAKQEHSSEAVERGCQYLERTFRPGTGFPTHVSEFKDFARRSMAPDEVFTNAVAALALVDSNISPAFLKELLNLVELASNEEGLVHFFVDAALLVADMDCTAVAHSLFLQCGRPSSRLRNIVDRMVSNTLPNGVIEVYAQPAGEHAGRVDPFVLANVLYLLHQTGREEEASASQALVLATLVDGEYLRGSRYYPSPDVFLYFLSRLARDFDRAHSWLGDPLRKALLERQGVDSLCFDRALRVAASDNLDLVDDVDLQVVAHAQRPDGSWPPAPFFRFGRTERYFGSEALSTAVAVRALYHRRASQAHALAMSELVPRDPPSEENRDPSVQAPTAKAAVTR